MKAQPNIKMVESAENIYAMKRLLKIKTCKMTFRSPTISSLVVARKLRESRLGCPRIARVSFSDEPGTVSGVTMSKNNLSGIT